MIKINLQGPSKSDLTKMVTTAVEKQIAEKARRAASAFGGVRIRFKHRLDGSLDTVEFEGSTEAIQAARTATTSL